MQQFSGSRNDSTLRGLRGVTLVELMVVVAIIGVLGAIAYPNYREFAARAHRSEARAALLKIAINQERFYLDNFSYTSDMMNLGFSVAGNFRTETGAYEIDVADGADAVSYTASAFYLLGGTESATCLTFTMDSAGIRTSAPDPDCWTRTR